MSEQKTAKVQAILDIRPWDGPNGTVYYHKLLMDNDDVATVGKKKEPAFEIGEELTYTLEPDPKGGFKLKEVKDNPFTGGGRSGGGGKSYSDPKTMILAYAKDVEVAVINSGFVADEDFTQNVIDRADRFMEWYEGKSGMQNVEFTGTDMSVAAPVQPYPVEQQRSQEVAKSFQGERSKPDRGGGGQPPTPAQKTFLTKLAGEKGVNINQLITQEWDDIQDESQLSKWATSYLLDVIGGK